VDTCPPGRARRSSVRRVEGERQQVVGDVAGDESGSSGAVYASTAVVKPEPPRGEPVAGPHASTYAIAVAAT